MTASPQAASLPGSIASELQFQDQRLERREFADERRPPPRP